MNQQDKTTLIHATQQIEDVIDTLRPLRRKALGRGGAYGALADLLYCVLNNLMMIINSVRRIEFAWEQVERASIPTAVVGKKGDATH